MYKVWVFLNLRAKTEGMQVAKHLLLGAYAREDVKFLPWTVKQENKRHSEIKK